MSLMYLSFIIYFIILLSIVWITYRRKRSDTDFFLGKRSLNFYVTALSAHASDMSHWLFMAFPSLIYLYGFDRGWIALGLFIGMFLNWHFVAPKLRRDTEAYDSVTISGYISKRLNDKKGLLLSVTGLMSLIFFTIYISSGLVAVGNIFEDVFGTSYSTGIYVGITAVLIYTFFGGFVTVAWTDLFQALFLLAMILIVPIVACFNLPEGFESSKLITGVSEIVNSETNIIQIILLMASMGLGYFGQLHILSKFMGIRSHKDMYKAKWVGMSWQFLSFVAAIGVGLAAITFFPEILSNPELLFVYLVKALFHPFMGGIILCAILAATISTMDSQVLVVASVLSEDFYKGIVRKNAGKKELLFISRLFVFLSCMLALYIAHQRSSTIWDMVFYAWAGLGSCFGPLILFCLHSKRVNFTSGLLGIIAGGVTVGLWGIFDPAPWGYEVSPLIPGFLSSAIALYISSRFAKPVELSA